MRSLVIVLALICLGEARPSSKFQLSPSIAIDPYILGGVPAAQGEFPYQLSLEYLGSHNCGAVLITANAALCAAHCVVGYPIANLRIRGGILCRSESGPPEQISDVAATFPHPDYNTGTCTYSNDISIITLATPFDLSQPDVALANLPPDNSDQLIGVICTISGWGRTSASNILPDCLQKVDMPVISTDECNADMAGVIGATVCDSNICVFDAAGNEGSCNGDSGGPMTCPWPGVGLVVAGITSWGIQSGGACAPSYPSVYTRVSYYLDWIYANLPAK